MEFFLTPFSNNLVKVYLFHEDSVLLLSSPVDTSELISFFNVCIFSICEDSFILRFS